MIYEYKCEACEKEYDMLQRMEDKPIEVCPHCGKKKAKRVVTGGNGFRIHGQGVYKPTSKIE
jgi:putative FmdB family regulatory protein